MSAKRAAPATTTSPQKRAAGRKGVWRDVNRIQLAELLGVHPDRVTHYAREGMPVKVAGGRGRESVYDAVACLAWWREQRGDNAKEAAQARLYEANAQNAEHKLRRDRGELVSRQAVIVAGQAVIGGLRAKYLNLAVRLRHHGLIARDNEAAVREICRDDLKDIEAWQLVSDAVQVANQPEVRP